MKSNGKNNIIDIIKSLSMKLGKGEWSSLTRIWYRSALDPQIKMAGREMILISSSSGL